MKGSGRLRYTSCRRVKAFGNFIAGFKCLVIHLIKALAVIGIDEFPHRGEIVVQNIVDQPVAVLAARAFGCFPARFGCVLGVVDNFFCTLKKLVPRHEDRRSRN